MDQFVCMFDFLRAEPGVDQYTFGIYPCIAGGFFDKRSGVSYMFHIPNVKSDVSFLPNLERVVLDLGDGIDIFLTGAAGSLENLDDYNNHVFDGREYVEKLIFEKFPKSRIVLDWNDYDICSSLRLDKRAGLYICKKDRAGKLK